MLHFVLYHNIPESDCSYFILLSSPRTKDLSRRQTHPSSISVSICERFTLEISTTTLFQLDWGHKSFYFLKATTTPSCVSQDHHQSEQYFPRNWNTWLHVQLHWAHLKLFSVLWVLLCCRKVQCSWKAASQSLHFIAPPCRDGDSSGGHLDIIQNNSF